MGVSDGNFVLGTTVAFGRGYFINPGQERVVRLEPSPNDPLEFNRFQNGRLVIGEHSLQVVTNGVDQVKVINNGTESVYIQSGFQFQLYDDDDMDNQDGLLLDGDTGEDVPTLARTYIEDSDNEFLNRFAPAYIRPTYDLGEPNDATIFAANVAAETNQAMIDLYDFDQIGTEASPSFWTVYVLSAYQFTRERDDDPEEEMESVARVDNTFFTMGEYRGLGLMVFLESNGPGDCTAPSDAPEYCNIQASLIHEVGHRLDADHFDFGVMADLTTYFTPDSLNRMRNKDYP